VGSHSLAENAKPSGLMSINVIEVLVEYASQQYQRIGRSALKWQKKFPLNPKHPERVCWGCDHYCPADSLMCGNGSGRTEHPAEIMGEDWYKWGDWGLDPEAKQNQSPDPLAPSAQCL
jgi:Protein of unknown function (DUF3079)